MTEQIRSFGPTWGAPICNLGYEAWVPVGAECVECKRKFIDEEDRGVQLTSGQFMHIVCMLRNILGPLADADELCNHTEAPGDCLRCGTSQSPTPNTEINQKADESVARYVTIDVSVGVMTEPVLLRISEEMRNFCSHYGGAKMEVGDVPDS